MNWVTLYVGAFIMIILATVVKIINESCEPFLAGALVLFFMAVAVKDNK